MMSRLCFSVGMGRYDLTDVDEALKDYMARRKLEIG